MLNRVILIGRLTRDPELRYTPAGVAVTQFTLAVDRPFTSQGGEKEADFIPVVTWRQLAETCANYLRKGRLAAVEGRIQVRNYENNEGKRVYVTEVIADNVRFLESANRDNSGGGGGQPMREEPSYGGGGRANNNNNSRSNNQDPFSDDGKPIDISDDDLPF
ncbi:single-stranded DNA-binding protein [Paenibacillus sp. FSL H7-0942]|uniref:Single-stranded DNA-binding protein n=2 Tax=Paenibacillus TaxID=44249 RepID=A0A100VQ83_PAEAM|nr:MULTISPECIES: single-stranded DNA-binding protein [Paenibacillus]APO43113.1 single-stranded DNA-binding protein [Paenibacillus xylanexedens]ETT35201.1 single-strand-binding protein [Paenibacillus sp. FSL R5-192]KAA8754008.1 single-stranded DNA-binding protein [Paenibacillus sp. UASWS1643]KLU57973.1 single-stranded DNA-binding protein [Paenibacillus sp. VT-400]KQY85928.1 single-stranded DNA-binding protein [Paenibacillus sp. Root52]